MRRAQAWVRARRFQRLRVETFAGFIALGCAAPPPQSAPPRPPLPTHVFQQERSASEPESAGLHGHLRVSTATWPIDELLVFHDLDLRNPLFVRVEPNRITPTVDCPGQGGYRFVPEPPLIVDWTWDTSEAKANDPIHADAIDGPVTVESAVTGSYWLEGADLAALRQLQACQATHVVAAIRVGRPLPNSSAGPSANDPRLPQPHPEHMCEQGPGSLTPGRGCDLPLTLELIALDPFAPIVEFCPGPTTWDAWSCRAPESRPPDGLNVCIVASPGHPACLPGWPRQTGWESAQPSQQPAKLEAKDIQLGFASVEQRVQDCLPKPASVHVRLSVEGRTGAVTRVEIASDEATAQCLADLFFTARFPTFASDVQGIERTLVSR